MQNVVERAVAIIGNLSADGKHFTALREAGVMQRLVQLLEQNPKTRIPEIAAKTLANLAANDANQTAIRLAGRFAALCVEASVYSHVILHRSMRDETTVHRHMTFALKCAWSEKALQWSTLRTPGIAAQTLAFQTR